MRKAMLMSVVVLAGLLTSAITLNVLLNGQGIGQLVSTVTKTLSNAGGDGLTAQRGGLKPKAAVDQRSCIARSQALGLKPHAYQSAGNVEFAPPGVDRAIYGCRSWGDFFSVTAAIEGDGAKSGTALLLRAAERLYGQTVVHEIHEAMTLCLEGLLNVQGREPVKIPAGPATISCELRPLRRLEFQLRLAAPEPTRRQAS